MLLMIAPKVYKCMKIEERKIEHIATIKTEKMVKDVCLNETMGSGNNYSSAVPLVGLYIAAASMVCFLLILCDVWAGFRSRKYWFPCRFFSINSVTLTLISIATKLPVDLTSYMPSQQDQLSKLSGTVFICLTLGFMVPSIATNSEFESYANVTALTIFVVTVMVNICIQMANGVIFGFFVEHAIILICMFLLLIRFWLSVSIINVYKDKYADLSKSRIRNGDGFMLTRLKQCYMFGYHSCPQLLSCRSPRLGEMSIIWVMCSIILVEATLRSFVSKDLTFCGGVSDYGWSMWLVVASQCLTLALVTVAMGGRMLTNIANADKFQRGFEVPFELADDIYLQFKYLLSMRKVPSFVEKTFKFVFFSPLYLSNYVLSIFNNIVYVALAHVCRHCLRGLLHTRDQYIGEEAGNDKSWVLHKGAADMKRWMEKNENVALKYLPNLLSRVATSQESIYKVDPNGVGVQISLLSIMLLVEMAKLVEQPISQDKVPLTKVLDEVFEIILLIDTNVNIGSADDRLNSTLASVIHQYGLTTGLHGFAVERNRPDPVERIPFEIVHKPVLCSDVSTDVRATVDSATNEVSGFINYRSNESTEVVYGRIEQMFADMLHAFLVHLPVVIFNYILESPVEEYQDRVRLGLGFMCKIRSVESHVRFTLPSGSNITGLFHTTTITQATEGTQLQSVIKKMPEKFTQATEGNQLRSVIRKTSEKFKEMSEKLKKMPRPQV